MGKGHRRHYTAEFKQQAAELANRIGVNRAASQLGVCMDNVRRWKSESEDKQQNKSDLVNLEKENKRLEKENEELKKVNYILKKAAAFFSQDHLK
jgi:transposase-like protein